MRKVIIYIAMSLDGYVADKNGDVDFLGGDGTDPTNWGSFPAFFEGINDVIMGYKTYNQIITELAPDNYPYTGKISYVLTHKDLQNTEDVIFTSNSIEKLLNELKTNQNEGDIWINGGASIVNQVLEHGLADEIIISIIPTILGGGIKLFDEIDQEIKLQLVSTLSYNGITDLKYVLRK